MWWILALVAFLIFWAIWSAHDWAGRGSSLLSEEVLEDPPPVETDQAKRDAVLKQSGLDFALNLTFFLLQVECASGMCGSVWSMWVDDAW